MGPARPGGWPALALEHTSGKAARTATFTLDGRAVDGWLPSDVPLLWVLRDHLKLTGMRCGCGVCTARLEGEAARSCQVMLGEVEGKRATTIKGLSLDAPHPRADQ